MSPSIDLPEGGKPHTMSALATAYATVTEAAKKDLKAKAVSTALEELIARSLGFLTGSCKRVTLKSKVPGKDYFAFRPTAGPEKLSRPINAALFDAARAKTNLHRTVRANLGSLDRATRSKVLYSAAMSYCAATDLLKKDDKKTPGTFFEVFVGHLVARTFDLNPKKSINVLNLDRPTDLPTDFIFDFGAGKNKIHLPIKTSTRERVVQVWAHQRVLDGVYGTNRFKGLLVSLAETNMQRQSMSVVEVCLPEQWAIYQMFIAQLHRVYYFDPPAKYAGLAAEYPFIQVKPFADFFGEVDRLTTAAPLA